MALSRGDLHARGYRHPRRLREGVLSTHGGERVGARPGGAAGVQQRDRGAKLLPAPQPRGQAGLRHRSIRRLAGGGGNDNRPHRQQDRRRQAGASRAKRSLVLHQ